MGWADLVWCWMHSTSPLTRPTVTSAPLRDAAAWRVLLESPSALGHARQVLAAATADGDWMRVLPSLAARAHDTARHAVGGTTTARDIQVLQALDQVLKHAPAPLPVEHLLTFCGWEAGSEGLVAFLPQFWARQAEAVSVELWGPMRPAAVRRAIALGWSQLPFEPTRWRAQWEALTKHPRPNVFEVQAQAALLASWRRAGAPAVGAPAGPWTSLVARGGAGLDPLTYRRLLDGGSAGVPQDPALTATSVVGPAPTSDTRMTPRADTAGLLALLRDPVGLTLWVDQVVAAGHDAGQLLFGQLLRHHEEDGEVAGALKDALARWLGRIPAQGPERLAGLRFWTACEQATHGRHTWRFVMLEASRQHPDRAGRYGVGDASSPGTTR